MAIFVSAVRRALFERAAMAEIPDPDVPGDFVFTVQGRYDEERKVIVDIDPVSQPTEGTWALMLVQHTDRFPTSLGSGPGMNGENQMARRLEARGIVYVDVRTLTRGIEAPLAQNNSIVLAESFGREFDAGKKQPFNTDKRQDMADPETHRDRLEREFKAGTLDASRYRSELTAMIRERLMMMEPELMEPDLTARVTDLVDTGLMEFVVTQELEALRHPTIYFDGAVVHDRGPDNKWYLAQMRAPFRYYERVEST